MSPPRALYSHSEKENKNTGRRNKGMPLGSRGEETAQKHGDAAPAWAPPFGYLEALNRASWEEWGRREDLWA